jgi:hypothetical protein
MQTQKGERKIKVYVVAVYAVHEGNYSSKYILPCLLIVVGLDYN